MQPYNALPRLCAASPPAASPDEQRRVISFIFKLAPTRQIWSILCHVLSASQLEAASHPTLPPNAEALSLRLPAVLGSRGAEALGFLWLSTASPGQLLGYSPRCTPTPWGPKKPFW